MKDDIDKEYKQKIKDYDTQIQQYAPNEQKLSDLITEYQKKLDSVSPNIDMFDENLNE